MGKKTKKIKGDRIQKSLTLIEQIAKDNELKPTKHHEKFERPDDQFVAESLRQKITKLSRQQLTEDYQESESLLQLAKGSKSIRRPIKNRKSNFNGESDPEEDGDLAFSVPDNIDRYVYQFQKHLNITEEDKQALGDFKNETGSSSVGDTLREKITEKLTEVQTEIDGDSVAGDVIDEENVIIGKKIATLLKRYRSGPLPKQLKRYPVMKNWEQYIFLTNPSDWSAAAMYQVTRIFVASQPAHILQRYLSMIVLPRFRDDVSFFKKVNFHIYQTLCKAIFKPAAFHKGIVFPLVSSGDCTLREAIILGSIIARKKIPILHSAAAINVLSEMEYSGASSIFLRIYLEKKYHLPYRIIDAVVFYFQRFEREHRDFPVLWHQALLTFIQHYKDEITIEQKDAIMKLIRKNFHRQITPEIRREIINSKRSRAVEASEGISMETN